MNLPKKDVLSEFQEAGFEYIDNRKTSGIIWALYDSAKGEAIKSLERKYGFKCIFERRGAVATKGKPAWRVQQTIK